MTFTLTAMLIGARREPWKNHTASARPLKHFVRLCEVIMIKLKRKITREDLSDKGFPFECENCGNKPTASEVIKHNGSCSICGDNVIAYTVDTAEYIIKLEA